MGCKRNELSHIKIVVTEADINAASDKVPIITYLGGYCVRKALNNLGCSFCKEFLVIDKNFVCGLNHILIQGIDRGRLLYPQDIVIKVVLYNYIVVEKLCTEYEKDFLGCSSQRLVAINLTIDALSENSIFEMYDCCDK